jgi:putative tryptophan/tyrosine transport system substrate-binding protein
MIRKILWLFAILLSVHVQLAEAQQLSPSPRIAWMGTRSASSPGSGRELFRRELGKLGYVEGKNVTFDFRSADTNLDRYTAIAAELVQIKPDVIITSSGAAAIAAKNATRTIPVVFFGVSDPVGLGLVASLSRPGGNLTGITTLQATLIGKRLEILKDTRSRLSQVGMLWSQQVRGSPPLPSEEHQATARGLNLTLHSMQVATADDFEDSVKAAGKIGVGALVVIHGSLASSNRKRIAELAAKKSAAGDLSARRLRGHRRIDVLRT